MIGQNQQNSCGLVDGVWLQDCRYLCCRLRPLPALSRRGAAKLSLPRHGCVKRIVWEKRVSRPLSCSATRVRSGSKHPLFCFWAKIPFCPHL